MESKRFILLGITSDIIVNFDIGEYEELERKKSKYESVAKVLGVEIRIEEVDKELEDELIMSSKKLNSAYKYLLNTNKGVSHG